jgi:hypothetical protein
MKYASVNAFDQGELGLTLLRVFGPLAWFHFRQ